MQVDKVLDVKGLACPMPIVKTKKMMDELQSGEVLEIEATDKGAINDFAAWVKSAGHELIEYKEDNGVIRFYMRKK